MEEIIHNTLAYIIRERQARLNTMDTIRAAIPDIEAIIVEGLTYDDHVDFVCDYGSRLDDGQIPQSYKGLFMQWAASEGLNAFCIEGSPSVIRLTLVD